MAPRGSTPDGDPPVLAGRQLWGSCAAGFYARRDETVVLTSSAHCAAEGTTAHRSGRHGRAWGVRAAGVLDPCPHATTHTCRPSDMNYLIVAPDRIPWGRLNVVDLGDGGERIIAAESAPLSCADIATGDTSRSTVATCSAPARSPRSANTSMTRPPTATTSRASSPSADIEVGVGDSGGAVLVRGLPAGVTSRSFGGRLGFTPLAEGLEALDLELCTTPDCGLAPP